MERKETVEGRVYKGNNIRKCLDTSEWNFTYTSLKRKSFFKKSWTKK